MHSVVKMWLWKAKAHIQIYVQIEVTQIYSLWHSGQWLVIHLWKGKQNKTKSEYRIMLLLIVQAGLMYRKEYRFQKARRRTSEAWMYWELEIWLLLLVSYSGKGRRLGWCCGFYKLFTYKTLDKVKQINK